jgi:hypothetical protein
MKHSTHSTLRVKLSPIQSSQILESRGIHTDQVESNQVCASSSGFLVLFEQWTIKVL